MGKREITSSLKDRDRHPDEVHRKDRPCAAAQSTFRPLGCCLHILLSFFERNNFFGQVKV